MNRAAASFPEWITNWLTILKRRFVNMEIQADNLVLTKNAEGMTTEDVEAQGPNLSAVPKKDHFPVFILGMSFIQIFSFYISNQSMMLALWLDPYRRYEVWRFITGSLVHLHYIELWSIMGFQVVVGVFLETIHGWKRVSIIYFASVFGGSLFVTLAVDSYSYSYGASAGVYGMIFSHLASLILRWNEVNRKFTQLFCILFYAMQDITVTIYYEAGSEGLIDTSHLRHLGGGITGFLVSILVFNVFQNHRWGDIIRKICVGILTILFVVIVIINTTAHYPPAEWNFNYRKTYNDHNSHQLLKQLLENL